MIVCYLIMGGKHDENLVVSILSLRQHWQGEVMIWHGDAFGEHIATVCCNDRRLSPVTLRRFRSDTRNMSLMKSHVLESMARQCDETLVFLDCDTVVAGDIDEMFTEDDEVRLTPWNGQTTKGYKVRARLKPWRDIAPVEVEHELSKRRQAINTGVIGFSRKCLPFFKAKNEMANRLPCSFVDERSCQLVYWKFPYKMMDAKFNCSPKDGWHLHGVDGTVGDEMIKGAANPDPRIWHCYGRTAVWKPTCRHVWFPWYEQALEMNVAGIRDWSPSRGNGRLRRYLSNSFGPNFIEG